MKTKVSLLMLAAVLFAGTAFAADPIVGSWKLNVAKSKFSAGQELKASTRVYTEASGVYTLEQKLTGADGKEISLRTQYSDGKEMKQEAGGPVDTTHAKKVDANTWDFDPKKDGTPAGEFSADCRELLQLLDRFTRQPHDFAWQPHPIFGPMTDAEWMRWGYLHMDHHLRQFGA